MGGEFDRKARPRSRLSRQRCNLLPYRPLVKSVLPLTRQQRLLEKPGLFERRPAPVCGADLQKEEATMKQVHTRVFWLASLFLIVAVMTAITALPETHTATTFAHDSRH